jgi:PAS domain-containing protein
MTGVRAAAPRFERPLAPDAALPTAGLAELVNRLAQELAEARRALAAATQKLGTTSRTLEGRTRELMEARAALALLLASLDSNTEGILAIGYFGRAMHYNNRFVDMWGISPAQLAMLDDESLLSIQMAQLKDPSQFLSSMDARKANVERFALFELTDGRIFECKVIPQRVRGKRVGSVTIYRDVTESERSWLQEAVPHQLDAGEEHAGIDQSVEQLRADSVGQLHAHEYPDGRKWQQGC